MASENLYRIPRDIFNTHNLLSLKKSIHLQNHHNLCQQHRIPLQKFPPTLFTYYYYFMCVIRTLEELHFEQIFKIK